MYDPNMGFKIKDPYQNPPRLPNLSNQWNHKVSMSFSLDLKNLNGSMHACSHMKPWKYLKLY